MYKIPGKFRYPFKECDSLELYYSQVCQDIFVLSVLDGKKDGSYLEIGAYYPEFINNTYILSKNFNWSGLSIDNQSEYSLHWAIRRPYNKFIVTDALTIPYYDLLLANYGENAVIDYLQIDIEPASKSLNALFNIFKSGFKFRVITFETDLFNGNPVARTISRDFLTKFGYTCIAEDVIVGKDKPFEDWWVNLDLVNKDVALDIMNITKEIKYPPDFLFIK